MSVLQGPHKARRLSAAYKTDVSSKCSQSEVALAPRAYLASMQIGKQTKKVCKPSVGKTFNLARTFRYNASALRISEGALHLCLASDGVKVGGEDTMVGIGGIQGMKMASIPPPQVASSNIEWAG